MGSGGQIRDTQLSTKTWQAEAKWGAKETPGWAVGWHSLEQQSMLRQRRDKKSLPDEIMT